MNWLYKLERKYGKYAIHNLPLILIGLQVVGYTLSVIAPSALNWVCFAPTYIMKGQVWRLVTWVLMPPSSLDIFTVIMLFFYYSISQTLERTWGEFLFNIYILGGILITDVGMMIIYAFLSSGGSTAAMMNIAYMPAYVTTYYVQTSILLAFALTYPNMQVLLYFFIPVKMSWMGILYGALLVYDFIRVGMLVPRAMMILSLLNFIIYFFLTKSRRHVAFKKSGPKKNPFSGGSPFERTGSHDHTAAGRGTSSRSSSADGASARTASASRVRTRAQSTKIYPNGARHMCTVCGRTELDDPKLEFRFCSKCEGSHEYCQDHLFSHKHIKNGVPEDDN